jgi:hypothetical protein
LKIATEGLAEWWCPKPWTVEIIEQDWRASGFSRGHAWTKR